MGGNWRIENIMFQLSELPPAIQEQLIDELRNVFTPDEVKALQIGLAYFRLMKDPAFKEAMMTAMSMVLYNYFREENK